MYYNNINPVQGKADARPRPHLGGRSQGQQQKFVISPVDSGFDWISKNCRKYLLLFTVHTSYDIDL